MAADKIALGRVQTGTFQGDQMQAQARAASVKANSLETRVKVLELLVPVSIMLEENFTTTLNTAQDTLLSFAVKAGELWDLDYYGAAGLLGDALGMKYAISAPAGTVIHGYLDSNLTSATDDSHVEITTINTLTSAVHTVSGNTRPDHINVRVKVGATAGRVTLQACCTTAGRTTTIAAKAYLRAMRVAEV